MDIVLRAIVVFLVLWGVIRISGKRQIAQLSAFDLILMVTMGDLIGQTVMQEDYSLTAGTLAIFTFALMSMALGWIVFFFPRSRSMVEGQATVIIRNGKLDEDVVRYEMLAFGELLEAAREAGIRDLADVELAILEVNGTISFFRRDDVSGDGAPEVTPDKMS